ncbi:MAG: hypothetical protein KDA59_25185 [Planctomycetales bacterium]|nr:hypothetical protein [Planctomycetales bacterium]
MNHLCIGELAAAIGGQLNLGSMPPMGGVWEPIRRITSHLEEVGPGDLFWAIDSDEWDDSRSGVAQAQQAFFQGAQGVVADGVNVEPWAGGYSIRVEDAFESLERFAAWSRDQFTGKLISVRGQNALAIVSAIHGVLSNTYHGQDGLRRARSESAVGGWHAKDGGMRPSNPSGRLATIDHLMELASLDASWDYALLSIGSEDFSGEVTNSVLCHPDIAVINCSHNSRREQPHESQWDSIPQATDGTQSCVAQEAYPDLSSRQFELLKSLGPNDWVVIHGNKASRKMARDLNTQVVTVGEAEDCDLVAGNVRVVNDCLYYTVNGESIIVPGASREDLSATLCALAVGRIMGQSLTEAIRELSKWRATESSQAPIAIQVA